MWCYWYEFSSPIACEKNSSRSLLVQVLQERLPDGDGESRPWLGWLESDDPLCFPHKPPGVAVLEGGKLTSNNVLCSSYHSLQSFAVEGGAVPARMLSTVYV